MIKSVVFDFDGVLVTSNEIKHGAYYRIFEPLGQVEAIVEQGIHEKRGGNRYDVIERILQKLDHAGLLSIENRLDELTEQYAQRYNDICEVSTIACAEVPGTTACLADLGKTHSLYINSATVQNPLRRVVTQRGWRNYFKDVLGSPRTKVENLAEIMGREQISATEMMFVGDTQRDLAAARVCQCHFIGIRNPFNNFDTPEIALLDGLHDLASQVRNWNI